MAIERREQPRRPGDGLIARVGDKLVKVLDMSATGIRLERNFALGDGLMEFTLFRRTGTSLELNKSVKVTGKLARQDQHSVAFSFQNSSYALAKLVVWHASGQLGVAPHMVK